MAISLTTADRETLAGTEPAAGTPTADWAFSLRASLALSTMQSNP